MPSRGGPYWSGVRFTLEVHEPGGMGPRLVPVGRPFALIGRIAHADLRLDDRDVSARHVFLHADARGLFAVDLATRTGTRFGEVEAPCGWLRPGEAIEIAGRVVRLASFEVDGRPASPPPCAVNLLTDAGGTPLIGLTLEPAAGRGPSWALGSELAFVGRGDGCAIRLNQANVSRTHCALLRTPRDVYVIDLPGQPTLVNGHPPRGAAALRDGDVLTIGQVRFVARLVPLARPVDADEGPALAAHELARLVAPTAAPGFAGLPVLDGHQFPIDLIPPESREAVLGWMLGALHAGQAEILRRQDELQQSIASVLQHMQADAAARHASQQERIDRLAAEIRRLSAQAQALPSPAAIPTYASAPRPTRDVLPAPEIDPTRSLATAAWLLDRIGGDDNKSTLKSIISRIGSAARKADAPRPPDSPTTSRPPKNPAIGADQDEGG